MKISRCKPPETEAFFWAFQRGSKAGEELSVWAKTRRKAWARLPAKVYEIDVFRWPKFGGRMSVIAIVHDPDEIRTNIACLEGRG
jgi:hypothetical protein